MIFWISASRVCSMELTGAGAAIVMQNLDSRYNQLASRSYSLVKLQQVT